MPLDFTLEDHTLPNGLRVVVQPDDTTPTVTVNLWVGVGSRHEEPGRTGFAHLFEHLMFQGSAHVANGEHFQALMGVGGRLNATTWFDRTNYFETIPSGALELALWLGPTGTPTSWLRSTRPTSTTSATWSRRRSASATTTSPTARR